jgi:hypothetical protein
MIGKEWKGGFFMPIDVSIRPWKNQSPQPGYPNFWQWWRSPDVYVDNNGDRLLRSDPSVSPAFRYYENVDLSGEPSKGTSDNRLFAWIRNLGDSKAQSVRVSFSYSPCGAVGGVTYQHVHFKPIAEAMVDLEAKDTPGAEKEVEVSWDLSDLSEDNGGLWPAPLSHWDHFCVRVAVWQTGGIAPHAAVQHNFFNIVSSSPFAPLPIVVANSEREVKRCSITVRRLPEKWKLLVRGFGERVAVVYPQGGLRFALKPGEEKYLTVTVVPGDDGQSGPVPVEIELLMDEHSVGGMSFMANRKGPNAPISRRRMTHIPPHIIPPSPPVRFHTG